MKFHLINSGLEMDAEYPDMAVQEICVPLLRHLAALRQRKARRILVMLAAPPGAGKSTLAAFLKALAEQLSLPSVTVIGMDGFHRYQDDLLSHYAVRDNEVIPLAEIKGAPETFDLPKLTDRIRCVAAGERCGWPVYDRRLHNPVEDAVVVDGDIVLLEGNYLLLDAPGWRVLSTYADYTVFLRADEELLRKRLTARKMAGGTAREAAAAFVEKSDLVNARQVLMHSLKADLTIDITERGMALAAK